MSPEIDDLMSHCAELAEQFLLQTKSTVIGGNPNAHIVSPHSYIRVIRTSVESQWSCRRLVGENQGIDRLNPAGWNRHIPFAQPRERCNFILSSDEPQNQAGTIEHRICQRHP